MSPTLLSTLRALTLLALPLTDARAQGGVEADACGTYCEAMEATCPDVFLGNVETCRATCALYPPGAATAPIRCGVYGQSETVPSMGRPLDLQPTPPAQGPIIVGPDLSKAADDDPRLQAEHSVVPAGFGAVFLPAAGLTRLKDRAPLAALYRGRTVVAEGPLNRRLVVEPGDYQVRLGSGAYEQQMVIAVRVVAGRTTVVPPIWAALEVDVVDPQFVPFRGTYELLRSDTREVLGPGFGADELLGERLKIWVVAPGLYKLIQSGGTYRDRTNFATVRLLPGEFTRFSLVQDPDTSQFLGAGEVDAHAAEEEDSWTFRGIVGGDLSFNRSTVTGSQDGWSLVGNLFLDVAAQLDVDPHVWITRLEVEESQSRRRDTDHFQNISDRLFLHTMYTYRLLPWFGPYIRAAVETKLLPRDQEFDTPRDVEILNSAGVVEETLTDVDRVRFAGSFSPVELKQGAGGNFQVLRSRDAELDLRLGLGSRQLFAQGFLQYESSDAGPDRLVPLESSHSEGIEGTALGLARVTRWVTLSSEFDGLMPFNEGQSLLFTWRNQASLRLASFASLNYRFILVRNPVLNVGDPLQTEHDLQLRFSYTLF